MVLAELLSRVRTQCSAGFQIVFVKALLEEEGAEGLWSADSLYHLPGRYAELLVAVEYSLQ